jgi:hypothetical protein
VVFLAIVLFEYFYAFAPGSWLTLSRDPEDWARFGEYFGGTVGAIFGLIAFGGVLYTIREQRRQAVVDEFQRQMALIAQRVDTILEQEPAELNSASRVEIERWGVTLNVFYLLATIGNQALREPSPDPQIQAAREMRRRLVLASIDRQVKNAQIQLQHLVWCLEEYERLGGSSRLNLLYERIYAPIVCWIFVLGKLTSETVKEYFDPEGFSAAWRAAPGNLAPEPPVAATASAITDGFVDEETG